MTIYDVALIVMTVCALGLSFYLLWLLMKDMKVLSSEEIIAIIDKRIVYHVTGEETESVLFGDKASVWNAPYYSKLKSEVSEHLREAELDSAIILIEKQRLMKLQIEELKLRLALCVQKKSTE